MKYCSIALVVASLLFVGLAAKADDQGDGVEKAEIQSVETTPVFRPGSDSGGAFKFRPNICDDPAIICGAHCDDFWGWCVEQSIWSVCHWRGCINLY